LFTLNCDKFLVLTPYWPGIYGSTESQQHQADG
jgi:hypothetical protein